jgi:hypothetical protein
VPQWVQPAAAAATTRHPPGFLQMKMYSESQLVSAQPAAPPYDWLKLPPAQLS